MTDIQSISNHTIIIGRDSAEGNLDIALVSGDSVAVSRLGAPGSAGNGVSRYRKGERKGHCHIEVGQTGTMTIHNDNPANHTFVDGIEIESKRINPESRVTLGPDQAVVDLRAVIDTALKLAAARSQAPRQQQPKEYSVGHLKEVWDNYHEGLRQLKEKQKRVGLIRSACGMLTMGVAPTIFFLGPWGYILTAICLGGNIYTFIGMKNDDTAERQEQIAEDFQDSYVCPNPDCGRFLGNMSYKLLRKNYKSCPYCKSKYID